MSANGGPPSGGPPEPPGGPSNPGKFLSGLGSTIRSVKYEHLFAGISGGVVSTLVLHPLDLLKVRFAVDDGKALATRPQYNGLFHALKSIFKDEGVRGFYKGVTPNVSGAGVAWGLYFLFYNTIKSDMQAGDSKVQLSPGMHMFAAAQAGVVTLMFTNPIWVVKTRMCLQYDNAITASGRPTGDPKTTYFGMMDALYKVGKYEGFRGLYRGFVPGLFGVSHGAIQFMMYEELKTSYNKVRNRQIDAKLTTFEYLSFAAISKLFAACITYPYQVVRARLQDQHNAGAYSGSLDCVRKTLRYEGYRGLYKGLLPYLCHVLPNICLVLLIYEKLVPPSS